MDILEALRAAYKLHGWKLNDVAHCAGVSEVAVSRWFRLNRLPKAGSYQRLRTELPFFADLVDGKATIVDGAIVHLDQKVAS